jgi:hypothetical protein
MPSISEKSFGQRYTKGRELVEYLRTLPSYSPGNPDLEPPALATLLNDVDAANNDAASKLSVLSTEREARYNLYKAENGLIKRCSQIRDYVASIHADGKKSLDYKKLQRAVQNLRGIRISKKPPAGSPVKTSSTSEVSFGSMLKVGKDVLEVIKLVPAYAPSNSNLTVANFTTFISLVDSKNSLVAEKLESYDNSVEARLNLYNELDYRVTKLKLALAAQFGKTSNEYKDSLRY